MISSSWFSAGRADARRAAFARRTDDSVVELQSGASEEILAFNRLEAIARLELRPDSLCQRQRIGVGARSRRHGDPELAQPRAHAQADSAREDDPARSPSDRRSAASRAHAAEALQT
jgi:hypothetical protein